MPNYEFSQRFASNSDLRVKEIAVFLRQMQQALGVSGWVDGRARTVTATPKCVEGALKAVSEPDSVRFGVTLVLRSRDDDKIVLILLNVGGAKLNENYFRTDFSRLGTLPDLRYFRESIQALHPDEAMIREVQNDRNIGMKRRGLHPKHPFERPRMLHWFHYLNAKKVELLGGFDHCLKTPAFKVEPFCDGLLFQLTEDPFDTNNPEHERIQARAMEYLAME